MKLDLSSLPTARGLADAVAEIAPLHFAAGAVLVFGAGRLIPDYSANYKEWSVFFCVFVCSSIFAFPGRSKSN